MTNMRVEAPEPVLVTVVDYEVYYRSGRTYSCTLWPTRGDTVMIGGDSGGQLRFKFSTGNIVEINLEHVEQIDRRESQRTIKEPGLPGVHGGK